MNLSRLFEIQRALDEHIEREHPREPGENRLAKKILALQVELGELANEWRGFKCWSNNQEPRIRVEFYDAAGGICGVVNPLLEEYVDCLHFILSIGLELEWRVAKSQIVYSHTAGQKRYVNHTVSAFNQMFYEIGNLSMANWDKHLLHLNFEHIIVLFFSLGGMLGFTWDEIEQAYLSKNAENHARQERGY